MPSGQANKGKCSWMADGGPVEDDGYAGLLHAVHGTPDVIDVGNHEVDVVQSISFALKQCEGVMQRIGKTAQKRNPAGT